jgi:hypothetical protein
LLGGLPTNLQDAVDGRTDRSIRASFRRLHWHHHVAYVLGARVANTISASGLRPRKQAGHLIASDLARSLFQS